MYRQDNDYRGIPIAAAVVRTSFDEDDLRRDALLRDVLQGNISLEQRLEDIPKFTYTFNGLKSKGRDYFGTSVEELRKIWKEGYREVEVEVTESWLKKLWYGFRGSLDGIVFDKKEEVVIEEEAALEERIDEVLKNLRVAREDEKRYKVKLVSARQSLNKYLGRLEERYRQDVETYPKLTSFASNLREEISDLEERLKEDVSVEERRQFQDQVERGKEYFSALVNQMSYMKNEIVLLKNAKGKYSKMKVRMSSMIDKKEAKLREALVRMKRAEMTKDLGVIIEAADTFMDLEDEVQNVADLNDEAHQVLEAAFDAVESTGRPETVDLDSDGEYYRDDLFERKSSEFDTLVAEGIPR